MRGSEADQGMRPRKVRPHAPSPGSPLGDSQRICAMTRFQDLRQDLLMPRDTLLRPRARLAVRSSNSSRTRYPPGDAPSAGRNTVSVGEDKRSSRKRNGRDRIAGVPPSSERRSLLPRFQACPVDGRRLCPGRQRSHKCCVASIERWSPHRRLPRDSLRRDADGCVPAAESCRGHRHVPVHGAELARCRLRDCSDSHVSSPRGRSREVRESCRRRGSPA